MRRYRVSRRAPIVDFIVAALEASGARILNTPDATSAPFEILIENAAGQRLDLTCYAFLANKYRQKGRPADEHRFQVKYGSEFHTYHRLYLPERAGQVTLFFGAHLEEGLFVACDPAMHEWTRFSRSVEFKTEHLEQARRTGWYGWERDRSLVRRRAPAPQEDARTEILIAFRPEHFLRYVAFEQIATGMEPGERLLLAEKIGAAAGDRDRRLVHPLERELGLTAHEILDLIGGAFRLKAAVRGSAAEHHLGEYLKTLPGVSRVTPIDEDARPDFEIVIRRRSLLIECKNVLRKLTAAGPRVDFQKTRASKSNPCSRYYQVGQFDILAACLHPITERWEFRFTATTSLPMHPTCNGRLSPRVVVGGDPWHADLSDLLECGSLGAMTLPLANRPHSELRNRRDGRE